MIEQNLFSISADRWRVDRLLAFTNPTSACVRSVSIVTNPPRSGDAYHASSPVSETYGSDSSAGKCAADSPSSDLIRTPCRSAEETGNPGVK